MNSNIINHILNLYSIYNRIKNLIIFITHFIPTIEKIQEYQDYHLQQNNHFHYFDD